MNPDIPETEWRWPFFSRKEMVCKGSGECRMSPAFMDKLVGLRMLYGKPMVVTSGYRSPAYNQAVSTTGNDGPHTTGRAVDISISRTEAYKLLKLALEHGFTGIGIKQHSESRFLHLADRDWETAWL